MPKFDVEIETLDRCSSFSIEWESIDSSHIVRELKRDGGVDVAMDDNVEVVEFYPLAGIRKITIKPAEEENAGG